MSARFLPKYPSEIFLEFRSVDRFLYRVSDLYTLDQFVDQPLLDRLDNCHIYLLGKRPRISIVPNSVHTDTEAVRFSIEYKLKGITNQVDTFIPRNLFTNEEATFEAAPYPHRELITRNSLSTTLATTLIANFIHVMPGVPQEIGDLEIVYIGKGLSKSAQDRLEKHATLQRILAEFNSNEPDAEVFALVHSFEYKKNALLFPNQPTEITGEAVTRRSKQALTYRPSLDDQVQIVEASLIAYFKTDRYNTHYLDFPKPSYKVLEGIYAADFAAIIVQLDNTPILNQRIFSKAVAPESNHYIVIDFRQLENKTSFLTRRDS